MGEEASKNKDHAARRFYPGLPGALDLDLIQVCEERWKTTTAIVDWKVAHGVIPGYGLSHKWAYTLLCSIPKSW